ncbi:helix-turn-helix domain-containing protein [Chryseobacterium sp.]|uniref:helix-turn-helix domain-containing protein n=1 Tax=Chryseobacterium sp. TaxID=1871047 RepID=UPI0025C37720|nr:helix-turn-helix domain-containing protein [Chryseobacterium sp.]MBV8326524.1 AraC family transcriptional regulator [Chryseobacterium sp.]
MSIVYLEKNLEWEDRIADNIAYIPLAGKSVVSNFRSPDSYVFIFFEKCQGMHSIDFVTYKESDHQIHISFPGQIHSWKTESATGHKLIISKKFVEMNLFDTRFSSQYLNHHPVVSLSVDQSEKLSNEFNIVSREIGDEKIPRKIISLRIQLIINLINHMMEEKGRSEQAKTKIHPVVSHFYSLIEDCFPISKSVSFYAEKLAVTPNYLNVLVKSEIGQTAKDVIDARVVLEAKRMMLGTTRSIKQISFDLGFESISFFSAYIFRKTGFYPRKFREKGNEK